MSGRVGDLSEEQAWKLDEFRKAISDVIRPDDDDYYLLTWLRARKFDVAAAETMFRKNLEWRKEIGADELGEDYPFPEIIRYYTPGNLIGHDKEGCPVWIVPYKDVDYKGLFATEKLKNLYIKYFVQCGERTVADAKRQSEKLGKRIDLHIQIHDFEGMPIWQPWKSILEVFGNCFKIMESNYPERLKVGYVINFPKYAEILIPLFRMIVSPDTQRKFKFFPTGSEGWKKELLEYIDPSELPKHWGGTKVDANGDPKCSKLVRFPSKVPESLYRFSPDQYLSSHPNSKVTVVQRSSIYKVEVQVEKGGSMIEWHFMTEDRDIKFGLFRSRETSQIDVKNSDDPLNEIPVIPIERVESHIAPEDGIYKCEMPGTYILVFDNSYSWYLKKKLIYNVRVVPPLNII